MSGIAVSDQCRAPTGELRVVLVPELASDRVACGDADGRGRRRRRRRAQCPRPRSCRPPAVPLPQQCHCVLSGGVRSVSPDRSLGSKDAGSAGVGSVATNMRVGPGDPGARPVADDRSALPSVGQPCGTLVARRPRAGWRVSHRRGDGPEHWRTTWTRTRSRPGGSAGRSGSTRPRAPGGWPTVTSRRCRARRWTRSTARPRVTRSQGSSGSAGRASSRSPAGCTRPATAAGPGRSGSSPASATRRRPTSATR